MRITRIGGRTVLIEWNGWRILTDRQATTVVTTVAGAKQTQHPDVRGLAAGDRIILEAQGCSPLAITATPCRHGPPLTTPIVGHVVGFALTLDSAPRPGLWMTGDTVIHGALRTAAQHLRPDVMLAHIGSVRFPLTGPLTYTMDAADAIELIGLAEPGVVVPVHVEGWSHFSEQEAAAKAVFDAEPDVRDSVRWLPLGEPVELAEWRRLPEGAQTPADRLGADFRGAPNDEHYACARRRIRAHRR